MPQANLTRLHSVDRPVATTDGTHPEEIRWEVDLRIGDRIGLRSSLRTTPAGVISAGIMAAAAGWALAALLRARRRSAG